MRKLFRATVLLASIALPNISSADEPTETRLHVRAAEPHLRAKLFVRVDGTDDYVCEAPCDPIVPAGAEIVTRLDDDGPPSRRWRLRDDARELDVMVRPSHASKNLGWVFIAVGVACAIGGGYLLSTAESASKRPASEGMFAGFGTALAHYFGGAGLLVVGVVLPIGGVIRLTTEPPPSLSVTPSR